MCDKGRSQALTDLRGSHDPWGLTLAARLWRARIANFGWRLKNTQIWGNNYHKFEFGPFYYPKCKLRPAKLDIN